MSKGEIEIRVVTRNIGSGKPLRCAASCQLFHDTHCILNLDAQPGIIGPRCLKDGTHFMTHRKRVVRPVGKTIVKSGIKGGKDG